MRPTLSSGDFVFVDPKAFERQPPREGDVVVAKHPYRNQVLIKRVAGVAGDGLYLLGDQLDMSTDSRNFGKLCHSAILGQVKSRISSDKRGS